MQSGSPLDVGLEPRSPPTCFLLFGCRQHLARTRQVPTLFRVFRRYGPRLGRPFYIVGVDRRGLAAAYSDADWRSEMRTAVKDVLSKAQDWTDVVDDTRWREFEPLLHYVDVSEGYGDLATLVRSLDPDGGQLLRHVYYLATQPDQFAEIPRNLQEAGLMPCIWMQ